MALKPVPRELPAPGKDSPRSDDEEEFASIDQATFWTPNHRKPSSIGGLALLSAFLIVLRLLSAAYLVAVISSRFEEYTLYARYRQKYGT